MAQTQGSFKKPSSINVTCGAVSLRYDRRRRKATSLRKERIGVSGPINSCCISVSFLWGYCFRVDYQEEILRESLGWGGDVSSFDSLT